MKKLAIGILIVSLLILTAGSSFAEKSYFKGDPSETYYMCVNADDFYWDKYLKRRGTKGIKE